MSRDMRVTAKPEIEIILPVYNEKEALPLVLSEWATMLESHKIRYNFILCEDGSTDGTKDILPQLCEKFPVIISQKPYRRGYGNAMLDGLHLSTAKYVLCIDSDGQCDPEDFPMLWKNKTPEHVIIGTRVKRKDTKLRQVYTRMFYVYFWLLFRGNIKDPSSCFLLAPSAIMKKYSKEIAYSAESFRWGVSAVCLKNNVPVDEFPINHRSRIAGKTRVFTVRTVPEIVWRGIVGLWKIRFVPKTASN